MRLRTKVSAMLAAATVAAAGLVSLQAEPSQAAARDGKCDPGEFCYFYNTDYKGSVSDFTASVADYGTTQPSCYEYKGAGDGKGRCIKNDAASAQNNTNQYVRVYYNSNYAGPYVELAPNTRANLTNLRSTPAGTNLKNNNASHRFMGTAPPTTQPSTTMAQFYDLTKGQAWPNVNGTHKGQCVSLVSKYMNWRWGIGQVYGNARDYRADLYAGTEMKRLGFTWSTSKTDLKDGDILVWDHSPYGHIGIWYSGKVYHQNWGTYAAKLTPFDEVNASKPYAGRWRKG
ncbi:MAG: peptidase inhibitor family I36 protein [Micrococcales bacterium]|nr:peptidase inhibitor family I36 protein [Micrococcales bacterium]